MGCDQHGNDGADLAKKFRAAHDRTVGRNTQLRDVFGEQVGTVCVIVSGFADDLVRRNSDASVDVERRLTAMERDTDSDDVSVYLFDQAGRLNRHYAMSQGDSYFRAGSTQACFDPAHGVSIQVYPSGAVLVIFETTQRGA